MRLDYDSKGAILVQNWRPPMAIPAPVIDGDAALDHLRIALNEGKLDEFSKAMLTLAIAFHGVYSGQLSAESFAAIALECAERV